MKELFILLLSCSFLCGNELSKSEKITLDNYYNSQIIDYFEPYTHPVVNEVFIGDFYKISSQVEYYRDNASATYEMYAVKLNDSFQMVEKGKNLLSMLKPSFAIKSKTDVEKVSTALGKLLHMRKAKKILSKDGKWIVAISETGSGSYDDKSYVDYYGYFIETDTNGKITKITFPKGDIRLEE